MFQNDKFDTFNPNPDDNMVGTGLFYNCTRTQVRDMTNQTC